MRIKPPFRTAGEHVRWIQQVAGTFENDPEFEEMIRLGREFRQSQTYEKEIEQQNNAQTD
ncbi:MAG: hypothetical protein WD768_18070 [Phycisphaeraceae bacterium]